MLNYNKILSTKEANKVKNKVFTLLKDAYAIEDEVTIRSKRLLLDYTNIRKAL